MARLEGMTQICDYVKRSDATVLSYIRQRGFPAAKLGSIWLSDTQKIDAWFEAWFKGAIENGNGQAAAGTSPEGAVPEKPPAKKNKNKKRKRGKNV
jgi:hypothetical protein